MNISEIKSQLSLTSMQMVRQLDATTSVAQPWLSHWDNTKRLRVIMHEDTFVKIKANPSIGGLAYKTEEVLATDSRAAYTRIVVIEPKNIEAEF